MFEHYFESPTLVRPFLLLAYLINLEPNSWFSWGLTPTLARVVPTPLAAHMRTCDQSPSPKLMISHTSKVHHPLISCVIGALSMRQVMDRLCTLTTTGVCILLSSLDAILLHIKSHSPSKGLNVIGQGAKKKTFRETISTSVWGEGKCGSSPPIYGVNENGGQNCPL
jgi:hypothetical protein